MSMEGSGGERAYKIGLDVGSTTCKVAVVDPTTDALIFGGYRRHHAELAPTLAKLLEEAFDACGDVAVLVSVCGSGGTPLADALGVGYIQEVVANAAAVGRLYPQTRCAIELGGQDAKVVFFRPDDESGRLVAYDMRMNGSCAGGTGAFMEEVATLLDAPDGRLETLACKGKSVYPISGRCGVFAKTDIQPLLMQGVAREDLALSAFHAIAKQTIGGLAQGLALEPPIVFEGGPLAYSPTLVDVFAERLELAESEVLVPEHPETMVAFGAALMAKAREGAPATLAELSSRLEGLCASDALAGGAENASPLFASEAELAAFRARHDAEKGAFGEAGEAVYVGIDSGSTTSKVALLNEDGVVFDTAYLHNDGNPVKSIQSALLGLYDKYAGMGRKLRVKRIATTGYGAKMMAAALGADASKVETVAHARAAVEYVPDASFVLDIGGQDMKAIRLEDGTVTDVMLNEACSSGCGSFLENFARMLNIPLEEMAASAISSAAPASLGSRCTVFMNSTVITAQRAGKQAADIIAGLCRSIIENVFTKVVRINDAAELGERIVVQGGTFENDAVLRAMEEYVGEDVVRAPFPGCMGAIGAALIARDGEVGGDETSFIGFDALRELSWTRDTGVICEGCANACSRTITSFSSGAEFVTGNRCARGEAPGFGADALPSDEGSRARGASTDLCRYRASRLFAEYPASPVREMRDRTIGIPRVLEFWDSAPFWTTFFRALGYRVMLSSPSSEELLERGLRFVASDTICLPAKLVHGHVLDLCERGADRIFLPHMMHVPPEGRDAASPYMCAVIMGYPTVVRNSQDPVRAFDVVFDTPEFHWYSERNKEDQVCAWACDSLGARKGEAAAAFAQAAAAQKSFRRALRERAQRVLEEARAKGETAIVLAGRPYHADPFLSHGISRKLADAGYAVLMPDSLPGMEDEPLENLLPEVTNNFHARMLASALIAAKDPNLQYVQLVSFGCGHDAVLTDEITRILKEVSGKHPLVLKLDESDAEGSIGIRIASFLETMGKREAALPDGACASAGAPRALSNPYTVLFRESDKRDRTILIPNISEEVSLMLRGAMRASGYKAEVLPLGGIEQIGYGKRYAHNDICFPCQMVIGEALCALESGRWNPDEVAIGMVKFTCDCRMSHYAALLRKALDRAGYAQVPIITTDPVDTKGMHPGIAMLSPGAVVKALWSVMMLDILEDLKRKTKPYELEAGSTDAAFRHGVSDISSKLERGLRPAIDAYRRAVRRLAQVPYDRSRPKPRVLVTGELLVTYHSGSNFHIEKWLNAQGMEAVFPRVTDQLRKDFICAMEQIRSFHADIGKESYPVTALFDFAQTTMERIARKHPLFTPAPAPDRMYEEVADIIPKTLSCGEGWLMAAEIAHLAREDVRSFVILQPFGCLPNHVCGRGVAKRLKEEYPGIQILPLDLDPDSSAANIENRLHMLIMNEVREEADD